MFVAIFSIKSFLEKSNTSLVGPSPAPGSWMHRFSSSYMLSWKVQRSASVAGGVVGALHVFLCFYTSTSGTDVTLARPVSSPRLLPQPARLCRTSHVLDEPVYTTL